MRTTILLILLIESLFGNTYNDAKKAYKNKDYTRSAELYKEACDAHDNKACLNLGIQYLEGQGINKNEKTAYSLFNYLCKKDVAKACHNLGYMYANNIGTTKNLTKAISLYEKGCALKDYEACYSLGTQYFTNKDYNNAFKYYSIASANNNTYADHGLGSMYYKGFGVTQNTEKAIKYFKKVCLDKNNLTSFASCAIIGSIYISQQKYADAKIYLEKSCNTDANLTSIAKNTGRDVKDFTNSLAESCANISTLYYKGFGVSKDLQKSFEYMKKSAELGNSITQHRIAQMYINGIGVNRDYSQAIIWLKKSVLQGYANAQYELGLMYYNGYGVQKNIDKALHYYKKAAKQGNMMAQGNLSLLYVNQKDYKQATKWFRKAAEQGHPGSQINLGAAYCQGIGVTRNMTECYNWVKKAKENGFDVSETWKRYELWRYE